MKSQKLLHDDFLRNMPYSKVVRQPNSACMSCRQAHLACDGTRPCKRCIIRGEDCVEVEPKKRGRPRKGSPRLSPSPPPRPYSQTRAPFNAYHPHHTPTHSQLHSSPSSLHASQLIRVPPSSISSQQPMVTMFLSLDLRIARASDESMSLLRHPPLDLLHTSLYDLVLPSDHTTLNQLRQGLLAHCVNDPLLDSRSALFNLPPSVLTVPESNTPYLRAQLSIQKGDGNDYVKVNVTVHLGAGCTDSGRAYAVALISLAPERADEVAEWEEPEEGGGLLGYGGVSVDVC
ncbi:uncharacterized protein VTP21DRAFT_3174 [Calcarisporiella thermophila]|uniref:uncharacterized protein n=1 Tax=Calcarisporiella thermophila TaxID=911321 RepID=UPI00374424A1